MKKKESSQGDGHPNFTTTVLSRDRSQRRLPLLAVLLTQELENGGEIFIGITTCTHHTVDLVS